MDIKSKIKSNLKEAELYRGQGLLSESKSKYRETLELVRSHLPPHDGEKIAKAISEKINGLEKEIMRVEKKVLSPQMTKESQDLITRMFRAAEGEDQYTAALDGAKALIKFGQFQRARDELEKLMEVDSLRIEAARHMVNCYFIENKLSEVVRQYERWLSNTAFTDSQIVVLQNFIEKSFKTKGIEKKLPMRSIRIRVSDAVKAPEASVKIRKTGMTIPKTPVLAEKYSEEFEEFDILASIKKSKKPDGNEKK